ncbi:unnamed protein product [Phytomonas sp. Hart1]|nr:unnamed protein product [Phytomonas sp. Hart1]|eukprot:CCW70952.1 unnamed protein product [Phytomonas sp. isolate Hart1]
MKSLVCRTQRLLFGTGGTLGSVQKVKESTINYTNWAFLKETLTLLKDIHHPLVIEYLFRLNKKRQIVENRKETALYAGVDDLKLKNKSDSNSFDFVKWNACYHDEFDTAERISNILQELDDNSNLYTQTKSKKSLSASDTEFLQMIEEEIKVLIIRIKELNDQVSTIMKKRLECDDLVALSSKKWIVCVAGKAGGEEADLFARELFDMFKSYAKEFRALQASEVQDSSDDFIEFLKSSGGHQFCVTGDDVYRNFRHEIGVHKVQRVPLTDAMGKMQTSTAVVTMMPILDPVSVDIREEDCTIHYVRGSGPGGQGMQSSSNCVVLTHIPSGYTVKCHQSRSALGNKELALQMAAQHILSQKIKSQNSSLYDTWKNQWSSGERSEKMRTYNYLHNRVTDHRLGKDYPLSFFMDRGCGLATLHDELNEISDSEQLKVTLLKHIRTDFEGIV